MKKRQVSAPREKAAARKDAMRETKASASGVAYESKADAKLSSAMFLLYLGVTGTALLVLMAAPEAASHPLLRVITSAVGFVFSVVGNAANCSTITDVRAAFLAVLVLALHATVPVALLVPAWRRRNIDDAEPLKAPRLRDLLELVGAPVLFTLLYWYTFFKLATPSPGHSAATSYVCWHLGGVWLIFTVQGVMAVAFMCVMVAALRSLVARVFFKRIGVN